MRTPDAADVGTFLAAATSVSVHEFQGYGYLFAQDVHVDTQMARNESLRPSGVLLLGVEAAGEGGSGGDGVGGNGVVEIGWDSSAEEVRMAVLAVVREALPTSGKRSRE